MSKLKVEEFEKLTRPLIQWLAENHNPHSSIMITNTNAELVESKMSTGEVLDYIKD